MSTVAPTDATAEAGGVLVLIVGQSGVGKDTLLRGARAHFAHNTRVVFAERTITRPPEPTEQHHVATPAAFDQLRDSGGFAFHWEAHGLKYGVPKEIEADLAAGRVVICNASRMIIAGVRARFRQTFVIEITADRSARLERLTGRAREDAAEIQRRIDRQVASSSSSAADCIIANNASPEQGISALINAIEGLVPRSG
jgi:phosphonate metabolism protein PhnN/1,5-bisphosphokinase (PRPP-forming)